MVNQNIQTTREKQYKSELNLKLHNMEEPDFIEVVSAMLASRDQQIEQLKNQLKLVK